ncbi:PGF-CTERM sorting domain-containing protein [Halobacteriales archaeon QS_1_69_70]|nr:MAG: PGF-CTERM sorting domain-containing protein [Halobacteriales archaeon QS_1_69_70]
MRPEALLGGAAAAGVLVAVALAVFVPGFVSAPAPEPDEPPARLDVTEMTLSAGAVTGETATLETTVFLRHHGGSADNVSVEVRATDADSGLVADTTRRDLGTVENLGEREVSLPVTVPREGGYEVTTLLYVDGERVDDASASVRGVGALTPPHAESTARFHEFPDRPSVEYRVASVDDGRATLNVTSYLTNGGDDPESGLRLEVIARQADSDVVADRSEARLGDLAAGRTARPNVRLTVPDGYNYYLDVTLWRDGVIIDTTRAAANLDPEETLSVNETRREVGFEASDFETGGPGSRTGTPMEAEASGEGPGMGAAATVMALLTGLLASRRWSA